MCDNSVAIGTTTFLVLWHSKKAGVFFQELASYSNNTLLCVHCQWGVAIEWNKSQYSLPPELWIVSRERRDHCGELVLVLGKWRVEYRQASAVVGEKEKMDKVREKEKRESMEDGAKEKVAGNGTSLKSTDCLHTNSLRKTCSCFTLSHNLP